jgi:hypothetical protein
MRNLIGGLFDAQENANRAYQALENAGFAGEQLSTFVHKPRNRTARKTEVKAQHIGRDAIWGGLVVGLLGAFIGFLIGIGVFSLPGLEGAPRQPLFIFMSVAWGLITGGLTGIILGVAWKLLRSKENAEVMTKQIEKRGMLIVVSVDGSQREAEAKRLMQENGAAEVGRPSEKWDIDSWMSPNDLSPSLKNLVEAK